MQEKPYYCPNCRSNRVKFSVLSSSLQTMMKDAVTGEIVEMGDIQQVDQLEPNIKCNVCSFVGNEMRFVKQAERDPRINTPTQSVYY